MPCLFEIAVVSIQVFFQGVQIDDKDRRVQFVDAHAGLLRRESSG